MLFVLGVGSRSVCPGAAPREPFSWPLLSSVRLTFHSLGFVLCGCYFARVVGTRGSLALVRVCQCGRETWWPWKWSEPGECGTAAVGLGLSSWYEIRILTAGQHSESGSVIAWPHLAEKPGGHPLLPLRYLWELCWVWASIAGKTDTVLSSRV